MGDLQKCCICGKEFKGYGNNPEPYAIEGRCCDKCNIEKVIPARNEKLNTITQSKPQPKVGDKIIIVKMEGEPQYAGKTGTITLIDDIGQLHGTWGGCGVLPGTDEFYISE